MNMGMGMEFQGIFGILLLILDIYAIIKIVQSGAGALAKALWVVLILVFPFVGFLIWFLLGPKD